MMTKPHARNTASAKYRLPPERLRLPVYATNRSIPKNNTTATADTAT